MVASQVNLTQTQRWDAQWEANEWEFEGTVRIDPRIATKKIIVNNLWRYYYPAFIDLHALWLHNWF